jgi:hypothetical protein
MEVHGFQNLLPKVLIFSSFFCNFDKDPRMENQGRLAFWAFWRSVPFFTGESGSGVPLFSH